MLASAAPSPYRPFRLNGVPVRAERRSANPSNLIRIMPAEGLRCVRSSIA